VKGFATSSANASHAIFPIHSKITLKQKAQNPRLDLFAFPHSQRYGHSPSLARIPQLGTTEVKFLTIPPSHSPSVVTSPNQPKSAAFQPHLTHLYPSPSLIPS
jgi:hypothetical protein